MGNWGYDELKYSFLNRLVLLMHSNLFYNLIVSNLLIFYYILPQ